jgi:hypothetical protein
MSKKPGPFRFNMESADRQLAHDLDFAAERMREHGGVSMMLMFRPAHDPDSILLMPAGWSGSEDREIAIKVFRTIGIGVNARMVTLLTEAWLRKVQKHPRETRDEHETRAYAVPPSEAEDRVEVLMAAVAWRDDGGRTRMRASIREILRDDSNAFLGLRRIKPGPEDGEAIGQSWLGDVIPPVNVRAEDREKAMDFLRRMGVHIELQPMTWH